MNQDSQNKTNLDNKQILAIQGNDVSLFDNFDKFAKAINNKDLSQTFSLALNTLSADAVSFSVAKPITTEAPTTEATPVAAKLAFQPLAETDILSIADTSDQDKDIPTIAVVATTDEK